MSRVSVIHLYIATLCLGAGTLLFQASWSIPSDEVAFRNGVAAFLVLGFISESAFLRLRIGSATSSVAFIPYLAAVILLGPAWAMFIAGFTELAAETVIRRKPLIKVLHNTSKEIVGVGAAGLIFVQLGGVPSLDTFSLAIPAFGAAVTAYMLVNIGSPSIAIALTSGTRVRDSWRRLVGGSLVFDFFASPLALLLAFLYTQAQLVGVIVVIIPLFLIRHVYSVNLQIEQVNRDLLELMVKAIEARDPYTSGHSLRVSRMAAVLAREFGLPAKAVEQTETAALLHDVGKIHEEYGPILRKPAKLTPEEVALMRTHPIRSFDLVRTISSFRGAVDQAVRHHHENFDGSGYPDGLRGRAIPIAARIIMIADTADAMTTDRPYRDALSYEQLVAELHRYSGTQFDPELVKLFGFSATIRSIVDPGQTSGVEKPRRAPGKVVRLAVR